MKIWTVISVLDGENPSTLVFADEKTATVAAVHAYIESKSFNDEVSVLNRLLDNGHLDECIDIISQGCELASCGEHILVA